MKKIAIIFLAILYLIPSVGFSLDTHWCGKKIAQVVFNSTHEKKCLCSTKMKCCKDVHLTVKLTDNQKTTQQLFVPKDYSGKQLCEVVLPSFLSHSSLAEVPDFYTYLSPPFKPKESVYLLCCDFRI